jgi:Fe-S cluster assembly iron-binding protein IscA
VTERAAESLQEILTANHAPDDQGVRLVPARAGGLGMAIGPASENDVVFDGERGPLLIVDSAIAPQLEGAVVDLTKEDGEEPQFVVRRTDDTPSPS